MNRKFLYVIVLTKFLVAFDVNRLVVATQIMSGISGVAAADGSASKVSTRKPKSVVNTRLVSGVSDEALSCVQHIDRRFREIVVSGYKEVVDHAVESIQKTIKSGEVVMSEIVIRKFLDVFMNDARGPAFCMDFCHDMLSKNWFLSLVQNGQSVMESRVQQIESHSKEYSLMHDKYDEILSQCKEQKDRLYTLEAEVDSRQKDITSLEQQSEAINSLVCAARGLCKSLGVLDPEDNDVQVDTLLVLLDNKVGALKRDYTSIEDKLNEVKCGLELKHTELEEVKDELKAKNSEVQSQKEKVTLCRETLDTLNAKIACISTAFDRIEGVINDFKRVPVAEAIKNALSKVSAEELISIDSEKLLEIAEEQKAELIKECKDFVKRVFPSLNDDDKADDKINKVINGHVSDIRDMIKNEYDVDLCAPGVVGDVSFNDQLKELNTSTQKLLEEAQKLIEEANVPAQSSETSQEDQAQASDQMPQKTHNRDVE